MIKIMILGITGMLGSSVFDTFSKAGFNVFAITRNELNAETARVLDIIKIFEGFDYAINCIGIIKPYIDDDNSFEVQRAIYINGLFPHKLAEASEKTNTKIIQIATDCVYDGSKGKYLETDKHNAIDVYGKTKSLGEVNHINVLNLRCSIIGKELKGKTSLLEWFLNQPKNAVINGFVNHYWNGITTLAFAEICLGIIKNNAWFSGLLHIVPADIINKSDMLKVFAKHFKRSDIKINDINANETVDRTIATVNETFNKKLWKLAGYDKIPNIKEMIEKIK